MDQPAQPYAAGQRDTRPWGEWTVIDAGTGFVVKRIVVRPGQRLSLQRHRHRDEHWVVVAGTAQVTRGDATFELGVGGTTQIARGEAHRVANLGVEDVVFIEVQLGSLLSEDDIQRLEDAYGRVAPPCEQPVDPEKDITTRCA
ncbi:MAG TPA: phosphomannose isomerase type II C-terminal cupin domain [Acetobacteraceae bacterium]|jgi:mannose-6-phosphate isomerase-like protein (cupin superfamily)